MSRNKYILYVALVLVVVLVFALGSQIKKLQKQVRATVRIVPAEPKSREDVASNELNQSSTSRATRPQILVKFRPGTSPDAISQITTQFNDQLQDEIEAVPGLTAIHDQDNGDAVALAARYSALPEVEYAEPNYEISLDLAGKEENQVNDPGFAEQWAFGNINVRQAWARTKGSREIVVAVLDSGVEYTHPDLVNNIWQRPANLVPYHDRDLGTID